MFEQIIARLLGAGVRFIVVGGVAATVHGSARLTNDLDICYDTGAENWQHSCGYCAAGTPTCAK